MPSVLIQQSVLDQSIYRYPFIDRSFHEVIKSFCVCHIKGILKVRLFSTSTYLVTDETPIESTKCLLVLYSFKV